jgi:hypothetical protein
MRYFICFLFFCPLFVFGQERSSQIGLFSGGGVVNSTSPVGYFAIDYKIGIYQITSFRKNVKKRWELQLQYDKFFKQSLEYNYYQKTHEYRTANINVNALFHLPLLYKEKYKFFIAPGCNLGLYDLQHFMNEKTIQLGFILSLKQEINLSKSLGLHIEISSLNQIDMVWLIYAKEGVFSFMESVSVGLAYKL